MGEWSATAIAANDLIGSVLYTVGVTVAVAGQWAPVSLLLVCGVVCLFRFIFSEVGTCVPLNGGCYSLMLVASTKLFAAIAACCSILDYASTAVVSAASASIYFQGQWGLIDILPATMGVLAVFALLSMLGMRESAGVSLGIFSLHVATLLTLVGASVYHIAREGSGVLTANWSEPTPSGNTALDIFYGFCVGMLGVTGFETSANYIEEQKPGVFPKTMRNMSYLVLFFNPVITFLALGVLSRETIVANQNNVLSILGAVTIGYGMQVAVAVDAVIVLCGGVLTAFVGVVGLIHAMASDRLLPAFLLLRNKKTHTPQYIILSFLVLNLLLVAVTDGDITSLSLVFSLSFLFVLLMFAIANILLKYKRGRLHRDVVAGWGTVLIGLATVIAAIVGNAVYNPQMVGTFSIFFSLLMGVMTLVLYKVPLLKLVLFFVDKGRNSFWDRVGEFVMRWLRRMQAPPVAFFTNHEQINVLNKAVLYVKANEPTKRIIFVHCYDDESAIPQNLEAHCHILDHIFPKIQIDLVLVKTTFSPVAVAAIARRLGVNQVSLSLV
ncbi:amino acid transporter [Blyttiomyces helicus]|uniref:Amino acid transporter n=1 Tax=Blyttiomyces helicus TaxID=388810 RepID=A0A4P9WEC0_9FUNG|nr:amino acid transporter [Blyttiomyces helicus]|eukprot:RKO89608.1 amino acid transporter [Blyttiomyces helicus]